MNKKDSVKKIFNNIGNAIFSVIFILVLVLSYQSVKIKTDVNYIPSVFGQTYLNVLSGSMSPEFNPNDLILGSKVKDANSLKVGDIITFKDGGMLVTHRIAEIVEPGKTFATKGDANEVTDQRVVEANNIVSKYYLRIPYGGYIVAKFQNYTFLGLVWVIIMYMIISELFKEVKTLKKKPEKDAVENTDIGEGIVQ